MLTLYRLFLAFAHLPLLGFPNVGTLSTSQCHFCFGRFGRRHSLLYWCHLATLTPDNVHIHLRRAYHLPCPAATHDSIIFQLRGHGRCEFCTAGHFPLPKSMLEFSCNTASDWHGGHQFWPHHSVEDWAVKLLGSSYIVYRDQVGNGYQKRSAGGQLSVSLSWSTMYSG